MPRGTGIFPAVSSTDQRLALAALDGRRAFEVTGADLTVGLIAAGLTLICVLFHYEVMSTTSRLLSRVRFPRRLRIVAVILVMLVAHVIEVWFFGLTYWWLDAWPELGGLWDPAEGQPAAGLGGVPGGGGALDFVYYSVVTYTTLGFGDLVPAGPIRILTGSEALVGLGLITWTASFAFLEMQRDWAEFALGRGRPSEGTRS